MISITCDRCDHAFEVADDAGDRVACPKCGDINRVPPRRTERRIDEGPIPTAAPAPASKGAGDDVEHTVAVVRQAMFRAHPFWYSLMALVILSGLTLSVLSALTMVAAWLSIGGLVIFAAGVLWWLVWWLAPHRWVKLTVTNKRTIRQQGIVMRETSEVLHRHVTNVVIKQGPLDRILNVGYIGLDTAGQGGEPGSDPHRTSIEIEVYNIPRPYDVKALIDTYRL